MIVRVKCRPNGYVIVSSCGKPQNCSLFTQVYKVHHDHVTCSLYSLTVDAVQGTAYTRQPGDSDSMTAAKWSWQELRPGGQALLGARSSHAVSVVGDTVYVFGGEHQARTTIDSRLLALDIYSTEVT